jgi:hypothetical protein
VKDTNISKYRLKNMAEYLLGIVVGIESIRIGVFDFEANLLNFEAHL